MNIGAVILAGGKSSRMGQDKAEMSFEGQSFLLRMAHELACFDELLLSTSHGRHCALKLPIVPDIFNDCGPMGGLHAALRACRSDGLFAVSCDVPLFKQALAVFLCSKMTEDLDALVSTSKDGHIHPLCAVYKKSAADIFQRQLTDGNFRMRDALKLMRVCYVPLEDGGFPDNILTNINTPEEYAKLQKSVLDCCESNEKTTNFMLSGNRGIGKSTVIKKTLDELGLSFSGFCTDFDENKRLYMHPVGHTPCFSDEQSVAIYSHDKMVALPEKFDELGCRFLTEGSGLAEIIVMDELGGLEQNATAFQQAVKNALDAKVPVLGIIRAGFPGWTREISERADVCIIRVTTENRDALPHILAPKIKAAVNSTKIYKRKSHG